MNIVSKFSGLVLLIVGITLLLVYIVDTAISLDAIFKINGVDFKSYVDNTEEITKRVKEHLMKQSRFTKRLVSAFPNLRMRIEKIKNNIKK